MWVLREDTSFAVKLIAFFFDPEKVHLDVKETFIWVHLDRFDQFVDCEFLAEFAFVICLDWLVNRLRPILGLKVFCRDFGLQQCRLEIRCDATYYYGLVV